MFRLTILLILSPLFLIAQNGNSPYSKYGTGEPVSEEFINNTGMGGVGVAVPTPFNININPAFLPHNKYTSFEFGAQGEYKQLNTQENSVTDGNGRMRYLAFAFPISQKYVLSLGLKPVTNVSYNYTQSEVVNGTGGFTTVNYKFFGEGGVNSVYLSHGLQITDFLSLGLKSAYNFGAVENSFSSYIENIGQPYFIQTTNQTNYRGFSFAPSIGIRQKMNKDWYFNAGGIYEIAGTWKYTNVESLSKVSLFEETPLDYSTIGEEETGKITYPSSITAGISFEKFYKITLGGEFKYQDWKKYKPFEGSQALKNITSFSVGGQYIPNINSMTGYLNRVVYRFGGYYTQSTFTLNGEELKDIGGTLGLSLPVGRLSFINLAFSGGKRGSKATNIVEENYFRVSLGVTLNDRWFVRSKYE